MEKKILIGLDGVPHSLIDTLTKKGYMPNIDSIIRQGTFKTMTSSIPEVSSVAWSSIITGKNPAEHGNFGFMELAPNSYRLTFPSFNDLKAIPFWLEKRNRKYAIINVPATFPARELNGVHISGFVSLSLNKAVYPSSLVDKLKKMDYRIDVDNQKAHKSMELFLKDLDKTLESRIKFAKYAWEMSDWDVYMLVFTGTDRICHFLWDAYQDEKHKFHLSFIEHFKKIDNFIGWLKKRLNKEDKMVLISDHGFEELKEEVRVNAYLNEWGCLKLKQEPAESYNDIDRGTTAFALDPGRIYINLEGKYPRGSVQTDDKKKVINNLKKKFENLKIKGKKVIKSIFEKEDIYQGLYLNMAPELILMGEDGYDLKAAIKEKKHYGHRIFTGKHSYGNAFLISNRPHNANFKNLNVENVRNVINI